MTQKRRKTDSGKAIRETTALRWEPTHVTKPNPRVVPLQYRLELPEGWAIHDIFNEDLLTHCKKAEFASQHKDPAPPPDIINEEEEYEVEEIREHRKKGRGTQFLVHWKGYGNEHDQWMTETNLQHAKEAIQDYWTQLSR